MTCAESFASFLLHEGRSVIYVARQLGHGAEPTMGTYGNVIEELEDQPQVSAAKAHRRSSRRDERAAATLYMSLSCVCLRKRPRGPDPDGLPPHAPTRIRTWGLLLRRAAKPGLAGRSGHERRLFKRGRPEARPARSLQRAG